MSWRVLRAMANAQLLARDLRRSFQIGQRRIEVLRSGSLEVQQGESVFLCGDLRDILLFGCLISARQVQARS